MNNKEYDKLWGRHALHCQEIHDLFKTHEKLRKDQEEALARIALLEAKLETKALTAKRFKNLVGVALETRHLERLRCSVFYYMHGLKHKREIMALIGRTTNAHENPGIVEMYTSMYNESKSIALAGPKGRLP
jgi:hypothetical protein